MISDIETFLFNILIYLSIFIIFISLFFGIKNLKSSNIKNKAKAYVYFSVSAILIFLNPISNYVIFHNVIEKDFNKMKISLKNTELAENDRDFVLEKYGEPRSVIKQENLERWFYSIGPW